MLVTHDCEVKRSLIPFLTDWCFETRAVFRKVIIYISMNSLIPFRKSQKWLESQLAVQARVLDLFDVLIDLPFYLSIYLKKDKITPHYTDDTIQR